MNSINEGDFAIVCVSCDRFSSLWNIFFRRFENFWGGPDLKKYLISNYKDPNYPGWNTLMVGKDLSWSSNLQIALRKIKENKIIFMLEDAPLDKYISFKEVDGILKNFDKFKMGYLNLKSSPMPPSINQVTKEIRKIPLDMPYRTSFAPAIWKKSVLLDLLISNESAWEFEIKGSIRSAKYNNFYVTKKPLMKMLHIIIKGRVDLRANKKLLQNGERKNIDFENMNIIDFIKVIFSETINLAIKPFSYKIRKIFHRLKYYKKL